MTEPTPAETLRAAAERLERAAEFAEHPWGPPTSPRFSALLALARAILAPAEPLHGPQDAPGAPSAGPEAPGSGSEAQGGVQRSECANCGGEIEDRGDPGVGPHTPRWVHLDPPISGMTICDPRHPTGPRATPAAELSGTTADGRLDSDTASRIWDAAAPALQFRQPPAAEVTWPPYAQTRRYREHGRPLWAARCWGDGTCDGWLGLGHDPERWAQVALARHLREAHGLDVHLPAPTAPTAHGTTAGAQDDNLLPTMETVADALARVQVAAQHVLRHATTSEPSGPAQPIPCIHAHLTRPHAPHPWEPQPGMPPVHCPGYREGASMRERIAERIGLHRNGPANDGRGWTSNAPEIADRIRATLNTNQKEPTE